MSRQIYPVFVWSVGAVTKAKMDDFYKAFTFGLYSSGRERVPTFALR